MKVSSRTVPLTVSTMNVLQARPVVARAGAVDADRPERPRAKLISIEEVNTSVDVDGAGSVPRHLPRGSLLDILA